ncbi:MAG: PAS domain-containing protein [Holophagales bacterium]|nr:MAG: PAS domain-containing protein [Holophagales bacterium]
MPRTPTDQESASRRDEIRRAALLDEEGDGVWADLTRAAAWSCRVPIALLAVGNRSSLHALAGVGFPAGPVASPSPLLAWALAADREMEIPDTATEGPWRNRRSLGEAGPVRFFATIPLASAVERRIGALIVADREPRRLDEEQREALRLVARQAVSQWELRHRIAGLSAEQRELYRQIAALRRAKQGLQVLQPAIEQSADAVLITLPDLEAPGPTILYANPTATRLLGYSAEELVGRSVRLLYGPLTDSSTLERMVRELAAGRPFRGTLMTYRKDGRPILLERHAAPVRHAGRQVSHFVSILREVHEEPGRPGNVAPAPPGIEPLSPLLGELPDLCFRLAADGTILDYRSAREELLYVSSERFLRQRIQDVLPPDVAEMVRTASLEATRDQRVVTRTYDLPIEGASSRFEARFLPLLGDEILVLIRQAPTDRTD